MIVDLLKMSTSWSTSCWESARMGVGVGVGVGVKKCECESVCPTLETEGQHTQTQTSTPKLNFIRVLKSASRTVSRSHAPCHALTQSVTRCVSEATKLRIGKVYLWLVTS
jgi:hypothetical protein